MQIAVARLKGSRGSVLKMRNVANCVRAMSVVRALRQLSSGKTKADRVVRSVLVSAASNYISLYGGDLKHISENMEIREIRVDEGSTMKRARPRNKGSSGPIKKRSVHITIFVGLKQDTSNANLSEGE